MIAALALTAIAALTGATDTTPAAPEIDRPALTWCAVTPADGAAVTLITADGLHRTIADARRLVFNPGEIAALSNGHEQVPVDMTCTLLQPVAWAAVGPAQTTVIDTPTDPDPSAPAAPQVLLEADEPAADVQVAVPAGMDAAVLIPAAQAEADRTEVAATTSTSAVVVPAAVATDPHVERPAVHASILGRARAIAVHALRAVA